MVMIDMDGLFHDIDFYYQTFGSQIMTDYFLKRLIFDKKMGEIKK